MRSLPLFAAKKIFTLSACAILLIALWACGGDARSASGMTPGTNPGTAAPTPNASPPATPMPPAPAAAAAIAAELDDALVQISTLDGTARSAFAGFGNDSLRKGRVHLEDDQKQVEVQVDGAVAMVSYEVMFCPFAGGTSNCMDLGPLQTDDHGQGQAKVRLASPGAFAGVFLLTRGGQPQFVSGFNPSSRSHDGGEEQEFKQGLEPVSAASGGLVAGFAAGSDALRDGRVEVKEGDAEVKLEGAPANVTYTVMFCRFGAGSCFTVGSPLTTNGEGEADAKFTFPGSGSFAGVFILTRSVNNQNTEEFVTGFKIM